MSKQALALTVLLLLYGCSTGGGGGGGTAAATGSVNNSGSSSGGGGSSQQTLPPGGTVVQVALSNFFAAPNQTFGVSLEFSQLSGTNANTANLVAQADVSQAGIRGGVISNGNPIQYVNLVFAYAVGATPERSITGSLVGGLSSVAVGNRYSFGANPAQAFQLSDLVYSEPGRSWTVTGGSVLVEQLFPHADPPAPAIGAARLRLEGVRFAPLSGTATGNFTLNGVIRLDLGAQVGTPFFTPPFNLPPALPRP